MTTQDNILCVTLDSMTVLSNIKRRSECDVKQNGVIICCDASHTHTHTRVSSFSNWLALLGKNHHLKSVSGDLVYLQFFHLRASSKLLLAVFKCPAGESHTWHIIKTSHIRLALYAHQVRSVPFCGETTLTPISAF